MSSKVAGQRSESRLSVVRVGRRGEGWVLMKMDGRGLDPPWNISGVGEGGGKVGEPLGNKLNNTLNF